MINDKKFFLRNNKLICLLQLKSKPVASGLYYLAIKFVLTTKLSVLNEFLGSNQTVALNRAMLGLNYSLQQKLIINTLNIN